MSSTLPIPLHIHRDRCHHRSVYGLPCVVYDAMLWRAGNRCEICGRTPEEARQPKLYIDHDSRLGTGWNHVRGLVCARCNSHLRYVDNGYRQPTPGQQRYLDNAWFWTILPDWQLEQPWLPETCHNPNTALYWRDNPNRRWDRDHRRWDDPPIAG